MLVGEVYLNEIIDSKLEEASKWATFHPNRPSGNHFTGRNVSIGYYNDHGYQLHIEGSFYVNGACVIGQDSCAFSKVTVRDNIYVKKTT